MTASLLARARSTTAEAGPHAEDGAPLRLVLQLRDELRAKAVRCCHWKSNDMQGRSLSGENDLDLLVHRNDARRFLSVLARLGFNRALAPGREHHGVAHFYGLDRASGRLVHVHAHFQLVLGDDTTKNYRLPIEAAYLASTRHDAALPAPAVEFELALFVVRKMLEHGTWDAAAMGLGRLSAAEHRELAWLLARADLEATRTVVTHHLGGVGVALWDRCLASLTDGSSLRRRVSLGGEMLTALAPHGRRSRPADAATRVLRRGQWGWTRVVLRRPNRKRFERAGLTVAVVGDDGSGTTTAAQSVADWLGTTFVVKRTHLGNPRRATPDDVPGAAWALWRVLTARDRRREYHALRRVADAGGVVVCDGWPLPELHVMDGSRVGWAFDRSGSRSRSRVVRRLAEAERRSYAQIALPDVLVVLRLDPEGAVSRGPEDDPDVRARNTEVFDTDWSTTPAVVIDASQPPELVLSGIRAAIWERL
jgi:hypothetical protein